MVPELLQVLLIPHKQFNRIFNIGTIMTKWQTEE